MLRISTTTFATNRLIAIGYRKAMLDAEIEWLKEQIKRLSNR